MAMLCFDQIWEAVKTLTPRQQRRLRKLLDALRFKQLPLTPEDELQLLLLKDGVIDHILMNVIGSVRSAFEGALLEQQTFEERFQIDVFLGDISFETSYSLPGEQNPPRVRADVSLEWPTWSQSAYRSWSIGETPAELPELVVE